MTESLFYPVFVAYAAVLAWTLERPSVARQISALAVLAVLVGVRAQALSLALGTLAAILLAGLLGDGMGVTVRRFWPTLAVYTGALGAGVGAAVAGVAVPASSYNVLFDSFSRIAGILKWGAWNAVLFGLALGVLAFVALPVALRGMLRRGATSSARATGVVALMLSLSLLGSVALLSASPYGLRILHERNLFYAAPLILTCFAHWLCGGLERPFRLSVGSAVATVALAALLPPHIVLGSNNVDAPSASSAFFHMPFAPFRAWAILITLFGVGAFLLAKRPLLPILTVVLAFAAVITQVDYNDTLTNNQAEALSWVDRTLPRQPTLISSTWASPTDSSPAPPPRPASNKTSRPGPSTSTPRSHPSTTSTSRTSATTSPPSNSRADLAEASSRTTSSSQPATS
jgi:hypothetical protein